MTQALVRKVGVSTFVEYATIAQVWNYVLQVISQDSLFTKRNMLPSIPIDFSDSSDGNRECVASQEACQPITGNVSIRTPLSPPLCRLVSLQLVGPSYALDKLSVLGPWLLSSLGRRT